MGEYMNPIVYGFLLTSIAGASTLIGAFLIFFHFKNTDKIIAGSLSFAAGVMITVSLTDLIPESIALLNTQHNLFPTLLLSAIFLVIGILLSMMIDTYLPEQYTNTKDGKLYRVGLISMLAIILHNVPEGIATFAASNSDITLGIALTIAIALHNIPEGISISVPIYYSTKSHLKALSYTFLSGISELLGAFIAFLFLSTFINNTVMGCLMATIAGIMLHISFYELLPMSKKYSFSLITKKYFIFGIFFMLIGHFLF